MAAKVLWEMAALPRAPGAMSSSVLVRLSAPYQGGVLQWMNVPSGDHSNRRQSASHGENLDGRSSPRRREYPAARGLARSILQNGPDAGARRIDGSVIHRHSVRE